MAARKGRSVTVAERPIYDHFAALMLSGRITAWCVAEKNQWEIFLTDEDFAAAPTSTTRTTYTLAEAADWLRTFDPEGCTWDTGTVKRTGKPELVDLATRLLTALVEGNGDEGLIATATRLLEAA